MNKQTFELYGISEKDYEIWCDQNKKNKTSQKAKTEFFKKIINDQLVKDKSGKLIKKCKMDR